MLPVSGHEDIFLLCNKEGTACAVKGEIYLTIISSVVDTIEIKEKWLFCKICKIVMISFTLWCLNPGSRLEPQTPQESPLSPPHRPPPPPPQCENVSAHWPHNQTKLRQGWDGVPMASARSGATSIWVFGAITPAPHNLSSNFANRSPGPNLNIKSLTSGSFCLAIIQISSSCMGQCRQKNMSSSLWNSWKVQWHWWQI